jgi:predicted Zn-dependent peptidase
MKDLFVKVLINNYTIYLLNNNGKNTRVQVTAKAGFMYETKNNAGISHLLEHLLLDSWKECLKKKGTNCSEYWKYSGINFNAYTSVVTVMYYIIGLNTYIKKLIKYIASIISNPIFTEKTLANAKNAVRQELLNYKNNESWVFRNVGVSQVYPEEGPHYMLDYEYQSTILERITLDDVKNYFSKYYNPRNLIFLIYTNQKNNEEVIGYLKKYIRPAGPSNFYYQTNKIDLSNKLLSVYRKGATKTNFNVLYTTVNIHTSSMEIRYLLFLKELLCGDLTAYLYNILRVKTGLVYEVSLNYEVTEFSVTSIFNFSTSNGNAEKAINLFLECMKDMLENTHKYENVIKKVFEKMTLLHEDSCHNSEYYCSYYSYQFLFMKDFLSLDENLDLIVGTSIDEVQLLLKKFFGGNRVIVFEKGD